MRIDALLASGSPTFSFEFSPPRTESGVAELLATVGRLSELDPSFVSVTYGANGSTRHRTADIVKRIRSETGIEPMAHLTCVGATRDELHAVLESFEHAGIENVLALRGDAPAGTTEFVAPDDGLAHGGELAELIASRYGFCVGAASYPEKHLESPDILTDLAFTRMKVDSGASFLITQLFFDNGFYFDHVARARAAGITVPIIPGIMPITNVGQIERFTAKIGATIPRALRSALDQRRDDAEAVVQLGVAWATLQCNDLLAAGAPGIHFYTLNHSSATRAILSALRAARPWERSRAASQIA